MRSLSQTLLTFLLNACWQVALVAAVAALCDRLLRQAAARDRHRLWVAALVIACGLPALTSSHLSAVAPFSRPPDAQAVVADLAPSPQLASGDAPASLPSRPKESSPLIPINAKAAGFLAFLYLLWLGYRGLKFLRAWVRTRAVTRGTYPVESIEAVRAALGRCQAVLGTARVRVLCSESVPVPVTVGSLNPAVVLPEPLLRESDPEVLTSALGHELAHVLRRDYLCNLIYELLLLPLSFHPAAALIRRRIRETRELRCDELVTDRLLAAEVYARALVRLAGAAVAVGRPATVTVGINDADILEERVMAMLRRPKITVRRKNLLLVTAALVLAVPCAAATPFALRVGISPQGMMVVPPDAPAVSPPDATQEAAQKTGRARAEFVTPALGASSEAGTLAAWLKKPGEVVERGEAIAEVKTEKGLMKVEAFTSGVIERLLVRPGETILAGTVLAIIREPGQPVTREISPGQPVTLELSPAQQEERERAERERKEAREREAREVEKRLQEARTVEEKRALEARVLEDRRREEIEREARAKVEGREVRESRNEGYAFEAGFRAGQEEREKRARRQAELVKLAKVPMDQAIQIATGQQPGTVLECRLVGEQGMVFYNVLILSGDGPEATTTRLLISAVDGQVIKGEKERR